MDSFERKGILLAVGAHIALAGGMGAALLFAKKEEPKEPPPVEVSIAGLGDALVSGAPDAMPDAGAAPLGGGKSTPTPPPEEEVVEAAPEPAPVPVVKPEPKPTPKPAPVVKPKPQPKPVARPEPNPKPKPKPVVKPKPAAKPTAKPVSKPATKPATKPTQKPATKPSTQPKTGQPAKGGDPKKPTGKLDGIGGNASGKGKSGEGKDEGSSGRTAEQARAVANTSIVAEITPAFQRCAPSGVDIGKVFIFFTINLDKDARVIGTPSIDNITGLNDSNRNQEGVLKTCAIQAIKSASPYKLDPRDYEFWKVRKVKFNARN